MADATLYLFDGYNLASFVAMRGARGVVVFDGVGEDAQRGPLAVRYALHADTLLERLAAEQRALERVLLVTSDSTVAAAAGGAVAKLTSQTFFRDLEPAGHRDDRPEGLAGKLDEETRSRLERLRRGE